MIIRFMPVTILELLQGLIEGEGFLYVFTLLRPCLADVRLGFFFLG